LNREEVFLLRTVLLGAIFLSAGALILGLPLENFSLPWKCPFRLLTGHPCPGCGMTDALRFFLKGAWREAFWANPHVFPLVAFILGLSLAPKKTSSFLRRFHLLEFWLATILLWWLLRLLFSW